MCYYKCNRKFRLFFSLRFFVIMTGKYDHSVLIIV